LPNFKSEGETQNLSSKQKIATKMCSVRKHLTHHKYCISHKSQYPASSCDFTW